MNFNDFNDFKERTIKRCIIRDACIEEYGLLKSAQSNAEFLDVLLRNHNWCVTNGIYTPQELASLPVDDLLSIGILTQENNPLDFSKPVELAGNLWLPFNEGADENSPYGDYMDFETAQQRPTGRRAPKPHELRLLAQSGYNWGIYHNVFGMVFGKKLFIPASGNRNIASGAFNYVGSYGCSWSGVASSATNGYNLSFSSTNVYPVSANSRAYGFPVRCVIL